MATTNYYTVNGRIRGESTNGVSTTYGHDALGSVTGTYDENGNPQNTYAWAPYGTQIAKTGTAADPKFGWNGGSGYRATGRTYGSSYVRRRHFDALTAQWSAADPIWPRQRPFAYGSSSPLNRSDSRGLFAPAVDPGAPALPEGVSLGEYAEDSEVIDILADYGFYTEVFNPLVLAVFVGVGAGYLLYQGLDAITGGGYSAWMGDLVSPLFGSGELPVSSKEEVHEYAQQIGHPIGANHTGVKPAPLAQPEQFKTTWGLSDCEGAYQQYKNTCQAGFSCRGVNSADCGALVNNYNNAKNCAHLRQQVVENCDQIYVPGWRPRPRGHWIAACDAIAAACNCIAKNPNCGFGQTLQECQQQLQQCREATPS